MSYTNNIFYVCSKNRGEYCRHDFVYFSFFAFVDTQLGWLTLRLLMSYIYGAPILDVSRS